MTSNRLFLEECAHVFQDCSGPLVILSNVGQCRPDFQEVGRRSGGKAFGCLRVTEDRRQWLGQFVRKGGSHVTHRRYTVQMRDLFQGQLSFQKLLGTCSSFDEPDQEKHQSSLSGEEREQGNNSVFVLFPICWLTKQDFRFGRDLRL